MESLLPIINKLQDVMVSVGFGTPNALNLDLPQIVVVGSQSVGKSSVLESLVGRDFLPRGTGVVTRRPLILQLRHVQESLLENHPNHESDDCARSHGKETSPPSEFDADVVSDEYTSIRTPGSSKPFGVKEWGTFLHRPGVVFTKFEDIRKEVEEETERVVGRTKNISPEPILLKIFSSRVVNLTLIDLPGITKVPVGDQPSDIEQQIRRMILAYIVKPNAIILAVSAANTDLANSDALQMAREVDPGGRRTIGVITKCDLMDADTDAVDMLLGRIYPLQRGYVGVVCRSQKDINSNVDLTTAIKEEERFFVTHPAYRSIAHRCGTRYLAVLLNQVLTLHIQQTLPELKRQIQSLTQEYEAQLATYGDSLIETHGNQGALLLHCFSKFSRNFQDAIDGRLCASHASNQLTGGARINYIFHDWFGKALAQFSPLTGLSDMEIRTAIRNATGPKASLFVPEGAFEILVRKQIAKLEQPALQCVEQVYEELQRIVEKCDLAEAHRFRFLRERIVDVVKMVLKKCLEPTNQMISNLILMELAYLNTNHPDFLDGSGAMCSRAGAAFLLRNAQAGAAANGHAAAMAQCAASSQRLGSHPFGPTGPHNDAALSAPLQDGGIAARAPTQYLSGQPPLSHRSLEHAAAINPAAREQHSARHGGASTAESMNTVVQPSSTSTPEALGTTSGAPSVNPLPSPVLTSPTHYSVGGLLSFFRGQRGSAGSTTAQSAATNVINSAVPHSSFGAAAGNPSAYNETSRAPNAAHSSALQCTNPTAGNFTPQLLAMQYYLPHSGANQQCIANTGYASSNTAGVIRLAQVPAVVTPSQIPSEREKTEIELIKALIISYFNIVRKNVADYIPKAIMSFMVNTAKDVIQRELVSQLYKPELFGELLYEGDDIAQARERCKHSLQTLRTALEILYELSETDWNAPNR